MTQKEIIQHEKIVLESILVSPTFVIPEDLSTKNPFINIIVEKTNSIQLGHIVNRYGDDYVIRPTNDGRIEIGISIYTQLKEAETERPKQHVLLHPFDRVLVRDGDDLPWTGVLLSHIDLSREVHPFFTNDVAWQQLIPYNEDTKYLIGTDDPCPIEYEIEFKKY